ncbi:hypothetical protein LCGC14_2791510 [marine sediment metagenome]|uniref:Uncharacterized protein n=1 Tax=marine sediment metagenome TaxID=412755 RepID=A0A0F9BGR8_9ZZZZ
MDEDEVNFVCPNCRVLALAVARDREDKPRPRPECPTDFGHFALHVWGLEWQLYIVDQWNRVILCENCGTEHRYWQDEVKD